MCLNNNYFALSESYSFSFSRLSLLALIFVEFILSVNASAVDFDFYKSTIIVEASEFGTVALDIWSSYYSLLDSSVAFTQSQADDCQVKAAIIAQEIDLGFTPCPLTATEALVNPYIVQIPFAAVPIVAIYNVYDHTTSTYAHSLSLSADTLGLIFTGQITNWNDSAIALEIPTLQLPSANITVILPVGVASGNLAFTTYLSQLWSNFSHFVSPSTTPAWPTSFYSSWKRSSTPTSDVLSIPNSFSFSSWSKAVSVGNSIASLRYNDTTSPIALISSNIISTAAYASTIEVQMISSPTITNNIHFNLNVITNSAIYWPIMSTEYVLFDTQYTRATCSSRTAMANFLIWVYSDVEASKLLESVGGVMFSSVVLNQLGVNARLHNGIQCRGTAAVSQVALNGIMISGDPRAQIMNNLLLGTFNAEYKTMDTYVYTWQANPSQLAVEQLLLDEVSVGMIIAENVDPDLWTKEIVMTHNYVNYPGFITSTQILFNLELSNMIVLPAGSRLIMTLDVIAEIMLGTINDWKDIRITSLNPSLSSLLNGLTQPIPINVILACNSFLSYSMGIYMIQVAAHNYPATLSAILSTLNVQQINICNSPLPITFSSLLNSSSYLNGKATYVASESSIGGAVGVVQGSFGYQQFGNFVPLTTGIIDVLWNSNVQRASTSSMLACAADTLDFNLMTISPIRSTSEYCYPISQGIYIIASRNYSHVNSGAGSCISGALALQYTTFLYNQSSNDAALHQAGFARVAEVEQLRQNIAANQVQFPAMCDGVSLIAAPPSIYFVSACLVALAKAFTVIGLLAVVAGMLALLYHRHHPAVYSSKLPLTAVSALGLCLLYLSLIPLTSNSTPESCSTIMWLVNLGYTLLFLPIYIKTSHVYWMFGGGSLSSRVHHMTDSMVYGALILGVLLDIVIVSAWQGLSPITAMTTAAIEGDPPEEMLYTQCAQPEKGRPFLYFVGAVKAILLIVACLISFTVRRVMSTYKEQKQLALALYNAAVSIGLCVPIAVLASPSGDGLSALLVICVLWIAIVASLVLFAPKILNATSKQTEKEALQAALTSQTDVVRSVNLGFSFHNVGLMATEVLESYIHALEDQVKEVKERLLSLGHAIPNAVMTAQLESMAQSSVSKLSWRGSVSQRICHSKKEPADDNKIYASTEEHNEQCSSSSIALTTSDISIDRRRKIGEAIHRSSQASVINSNTIVR